MNFFVTHFGKIILNFFIIALLLIYSHLIHSDTRPNVIILLVDDLDVKTFDALLENGYLPHIQNNLINKGVRFQNSFVNTPLCCPSRATMLTGLFAKNHGVLNVTTSELKNANSQKTKKGLKYWVNTSGQELWTSTLPVWMQRAGYQTGHIGKYLNGYTLDTPSAYVPSGYDYWRGLKDPHTYKMWEWQFVEKGIFDSAGTLKTAYKNTRYDTATKSDDNYQTQVLSNYAQEFLSAQNDKKNFFLIISPVAPHTEGDYETNYDAGKFSDSIRPAPKYAHLSNGIAEDGEMPELTLDNSTTERLTNGMSDKPLQLAQSFVDSNEELAVKQQFKDRSAAMLSVDDLIGGIFTKLKEKNLDQNTVVIFTSDNGWMYGNHGLNGKSWAYEASIRVPLIIMDPRNPNQNVSSQEITMNTDLAPTVTHLAGVLNDANGDNQADFNFDGRSLAPWIYNPSYPYERKIAMIEYYSDGTSTKKSPNSFTAIRYIDHQNRDELYVHYYSSINTQEGFSPFTEFYDMKTDVTQEYGFVPSMAQKIEYDSLVFDFNHSWALKAGSKTAASYPAPPARNLEQTLLGDLRANAFSGCVIQYKTCYSKNNFIDGTLGEITKTVSAKNQSFQYLVASEINDVSLRFYNTPEKDNLKNQCLALAWDYAKTCNDPAEKEEILASFYWQDSLIEENIGWRSRNFERLQSVLPRVPDKESEKNPETAKTAKVSTTPSSSGNFISSQNPYYPYQLSVSVIFFLDITIEDLRNGEKIVVFAGLRGSANYSTVKSKVLSLLKENLKLKTPDFKIIKSELGILE